MCIIGAIRPSVGGLLRRGGGLLLSAVLSAVRNCGFMGLKTATSHRRSDAERPEVGESASTATR
jgi:hypothetical protein